MKITTFLFACLAALLLSSCSPEEVTPQSTPIDSAKSPNEEAISANRCRPLQKESTLPFDPAVVNSIRLDGTCLYINVSYSGGCERHEFDLTWDGSVMESLPPQVPLRLHHDNNGDLCRAWITETLAFNIEKTALDGYNSVILRVIDPNGGVKTVLFTY